MIQISKSYYVKHSSVPKRVFLHENLLLPEGCKAVGGRVVYDMNVKSLLHNFLHKHCHMSQKYFTISWYWGHMKNSYLPWPPKVWNTISCLPNSYFTNNVADMGNTTGQVKLNATVYVRKSNCILDQSPDLVSIYI